MTNSSNNPEEAKIQDFNTYAENTWCPGCGNFGIEISAKQAFVDLINEGKIKKDNIVILSGIGCHAKISDFINVNSFYSLHGRSVAPACGIKIANPDLNITAFAGDGDAYGEGISHLIFAAKRNNNINVIIHNNRNYALTTGQFSPTSPMGFQGRSTPKGSIEEPFNPLELMMVSGATFIARSFSGNPVHLKETIKQATSHKGFSFVDVLQPCTTFYNNFEFYRERVYELEKDYNASDKDAALEKIKEWNYLNGENNKIPIGVIYKEDKPTYEENLLKDKNPYDLPVAEIKNTLEKHI
jgi:2-oxoglutarate/2-oxoacid ferredoxin oxidoreductase subunit beta